MTRSAGAAASSDEYEATIAAAQQAHPLSARQSASASQDRRRGEPRLRVLDARSSACCAAMRSLAASPRAALAAAPRRCAALAPAAPLSGLAPRRKQLPRRVRPPAPRAGPLVLRRRLPRLGMLAKHALRTREAPLRSRLPRGGS